MFFSLPCDVTNLVSTLPRVSQYMPAGSILLDWAWIKGTKTLQLVKKEYVDIGL